MRIASAGWRRLNERLQRSQRERNPQLEGQILDQTVHDLYQGARFLSSKTGLAKGYARAWSRSFEMDACVAIRLRVREGRARVEVLDVQVSSKKIKFKGKSSGRAVAQTGGRIDKKSRRGETKSRRGETGKAK